MRRLFANYLELGSTIVSMCVCVFDCGDVIHKPTDLIASLAQVLQCVVSVVGLVGV